MPISDRHDNASKVVEHANLHSLDRFLGWAGIILGTPKIDEKVHQNQNQQFRAILPYTSVMPTSDSHDVAGNVVELENLHWSDRFPEWACIILGHA